MKILKWIGIAVGALLLLAVVVTIATPEGRKGFQEGASQAIEEQRATPTVEPTEAPTPEPTVAPTPEPTEEPTADAAVLTRLAMQTLMNDWPQSQKDELCSAYTTVGPELFYGTFIDTMEKGMDAEIPYDHDAAVQTLHDWVDDNC